MTERWFWTLVVGACLAVAVFTAVLANATFDWVVKESAHDAGAWLKEFRESSK